MHVSDEIMSEELHFALIGTVHGMQNWGASAQLNLNYTLLMSVTGQACSTFLLCDAQNS